MKEETQEFEELLENNDTKKAIAKFYKSNARKILVGIGSAGVLIMLALSPLSVWQKNGIVLALLAANIAYAKVISDG
jgi:hypothetical protein